MDDDEAGFLDLVDQTKLAEESRILQEERDELEEYRKAVAKEHEERLMMELKSFSATPSISKSIQPSPSSASIGVSKESQKAKLNAFVVKRKNTSSNNDEAKADSKKPKLHKGIKSLFHEYLRFTHLLFLEIPTEPAVQPGSDLKCIAILPGIGFYDESSDSDSSDVGDAEGLNRNGVQFDLCGRPVNDEVDK